MANSWTEDDVKHAFKTLTLSSYFLNPQTELHVCQFLRGGLRDVNELLCV